MPSIDNPTTVDIEKDQLLESKDDEPFDEVEEDEEEVEEDPIILPRGSYMDAVAKTWVDRSAYLKSLQQGKSTLLPDQTKDTPQPVTPIVTPQNTEQQSQSLVDSIWKFLSDSSSSSPSSSPSTNVDSQSTISEESVDDTILQQASV